MEYKEGQLKPPSTRALLRQQIEEQSEHCDVTIKVGQWVKRYHWCILVASPFFEAIYRNRNYIEQSTGIIELHGQSSIAVVEDVIMFLYGKKPKLHIDNIGDLLELADFFMLPTLKAHCVKWLKTERASCDTFFKFLHLASLYDLTLPSLEEYMRENIIALLERDNAVSLEQATLVELLNDQELTYIPADVWFKFLVKWTNADPRRDEYFQELFSLLDLTDVEQDLHQTICNDSLVVRLGPSATDKIKLSFGETAQVVIFPPKYSSDNIICYQLETGKWSKISIKQGSRLNKVLGVKDKVSSILYDLIHGYLATEITYRDLSNQNESCQSTKLINSEDRKDITDVDKITTAGSACYLLVRQRVETKKSVDTAERTLDPAVIAGRAVSLAMTFGLNPHAAQALAIQEIVRSDFRNTSSKYRYVANLYKGELREGQTMMEPIACFKEKSVSHLAVDMKDNIALFIDENDEVIIFNDVHGFLERINFKEYEAFKHEYDATLVARETGFLIKSNKQMCCITPVQGPSLRERFKVTCVDLPTGNRHRNRYIVCGDVCFRFEQSDYNTDYTFSYINLDNLVNTTVEDAEWVIKELPNSCKKDIVDLVGTSAFLISMPKRLLRCSLNCPHCKAVTTRSSRVRAYSPASSYYDDSDDSDDSDDYGCSPFYGDDDDYSYYYDSSD